MDGKFVPMGIPIESLKNEFAEKFYIIYLNYEKINGIEIADSFTSLKNKLDNFQKLFVFDKEKMYTIIKFGTNDYRMKKTAVIEGIEKEVYLDEKEITKVVGLTNFKKIKVRIAENGDFQYTGFMTGGGESGKR